MERERGEREQREATYHYKIVYSAFDGSYRLDKVGNYLTRLGLFMKDDKLGHLRGAC